MGKIKLIKGDITKIKVDAIVNAANSSLMGGGGVDGAIHRAGGTAILDECKKIIAKQGSCKTGEAVITTAGNLSAKFVIHTVGPVWNNGKKNEASLLAACYQNSLKLVIKHNLSSIAFPISAQASMDIQKRKQLKLQLIQLQNFLIKTI
jgi:O-acetyl-ADP-ribose deacetylase (regulator of RNase III)